MRIIRIITDGVPLDVYDDTDKPLEEVASEVATILKNNVVATILGKNSAAVVRPSKVSGFNILDEEGKPILPERKIKKQPEPVKKREQNTESVDRIVDLQD
jgi:hypothetical protein